jgi:hypothetical protein
MGGANREPHYMITAEQLRSELVEAFESREDAEQEAVQAGKIIDRDTTARLDQRCGDAISAVLAAEDRAARAPPTL